MGFDAAFFDSDVFKWLVLPMLIFLSRILDVSIGTMRVILQSRGSRIVPPILGFIEVMIWVIVIGQVLQNLSNTMCFIAYGLGFATGNYVGIWLEEKLAVGKVIVRIIAPLAPDRLMESLSENGFGVTSLNGEGVRGPVKIVMTIIDRKCLEQVRQIIEHCNPKAFITVDSIQTASKGVFPIRQRRLVRTFGIFKKK